jgi:hypothetical protein
MGVPGARGETPTEAMERRRKVDNARAGAAKARVYGAHLPSDQAPSIIEGAEAAARDALGR